MHWSSDRNASNYATSTQYSNVSLNFFMMTVTTEHMEIYINIAPKNVYHMIYNDYQENLMAEVGLLTLSTWPQLVKNRPIGRVHQEVTQGTITIPMTFPESPGCKRVQLQLNSSSCQTNCVTKADILHLVFFPLPQRLKTMPDMLMDR